MAGPLVTDCEPLKLTEAQRAGLRVRFIAKHALSRGEADAQDGTHAIYHSEIRAVLENMGVELTVSNKLASLFEAPTYNYLFTLFNRAGFRNSEVMPSSIAEYHGVPYLGSTPVMRALCDDKHLTKVFLRHIGVPTPDWVTYVAGDGPIDPPPFAGGKMVAKPNNSSASWGILATRSWDEMAAHIRWLHDQGHDVVVEDYAPGLNICIPVVGAGKYWALPAIEEYGVSDDNVLTYEEKRGLITGGGVRLWDGVKDHPQVLTDSAKIVAGLWPFDYGRIDFRVDTDTGAIGCLEMNLSCNLGAKRGIALSARSIGVSHPELVESILCHSLVRQNVTFD